MCITHSTMEAEFIALMLSSQEVGQLMTLLMDVPLWCRQETPVSLLCDSEADIGVAYSKVYNGKRRSIQIQHSAVKHLLKNSVIMVDYVESAKNLVDPFTKGLPGKVVPDMSRGIGLKPKLG